jgi:hypothetical protein
MKRFADGKEAVIAVPLAIEVIEIEVAVSGIAIEYRNARIAIAINPDEIYKTSSTPLPFEYSQGCI